MDDLKVLLMMTAVPDERSNMVKVPLRGLRHWVAADVADEAGWVRRPLTYLVQHHVGGDVFGSNEAILRGSPLTTLQSLAKHIC